jgi:hypothetical protein
MEVIDMRRDALDECVRNDRLRGDIAHIRMKYKDGGGFSGIFDRYGSMPAVRLYCAGARSDGYNFWGYLDPNSGSLVGAGCMLFLSMDDARDYWLASRHTKRNENRKLLDQIEAYFNDPETKRKIEEWDNRPITWLGEAYRRDHLALLLKYPLPGDPGSMVSRDVLAEHLTGEMIVMVDNWLRYNVRENIENK